MNFEYVSEILSRAQSAYLDYLQTQETEITRRETAIANIDAAAQQLKANREVKELIATQFFAERRQLKKFADMALDKALAAGDEQMAECAFMFMELLYSKNFFELQHAAAKIKGE